MSVRNELTGESIVLPGHFNGDFNPGRGRLGESNLYGLIAFDDLYIQEYGCLFQIPDVLACIDFSADSCSEDDPDGDDFPDYVEINLGSDPNNGFSTPEYGLLDEQSGSNACSDDEDNDLDGFVDRGDVSCRRTCEVFGHDARCSDPDRDGWLTYVELRSGSDPNDPASAPGNGDCIDFDNVGCQP
jgi:hypothetical protein